ncbi:MAG: JDVT-CTERM system CAAX-type protease [Ectothiorhodospiraceae bacterium]|nr:JDVT-CTERM system CAAX-type protease [Ectothiorhodospiraceae bacterium]
MGSNTNTAPALCNLLGDNVFWLALVAGPVVWGVLYILSPVSFGAQEYLQRIFDQWWRLLLFAGLYPLLEECLFRGLLQPWLLRYQSVQTQFIGFTAANVWTTIFFVGAHFFTHPPLWALLVIIPSLTFGWFRDKYQSVVPAIILHCFYNFGYFVLFL